MEFQLNHTMLSEDLPYEVIYKIVSYMDWDSVINASKDCRLLKRLREGLKKVIFIPPKK